MIVDTELDNGFSTRIDQTQAMLFPRLKLELRKASFFVAGQVCSGTIEIVLSIYQNIVCGKKDGVSIPVRSHCHLHKREVHGVEPVIQHDGPQINVVVDLGRTMDNQRTQDGPNILSAVMRVPPTCSVLIGSEAIGECGAWCDRTLGDPWNTVIPRRLPLNQTVPIAFRKGKN